MTNIYVIRASRSRRAATARRAQKVEIAMGMFDMVVVLDTLAELTCPEGHGVRAFHTKDLPDASMSTYLVQSGQLYLAVEGAPEPTWDDPSAWRLQGAEAIYTRRYRLQEVPPPRVLRAYGGCD